MLGDRMRVQQGVSSSCTDDQLLFIRQQGIRHVFALFEDQHTDYDSVMRFAIRICIRIRSFIWGFRNGTGRSRSTTGLIGSWPRRAFRLYT